MRRLIGWIAIFMLLLVIVGCSSRLERLAAKADSFDDWMKVYQSAHSEAAHDVQIILRAVDGLTEYATGYGEFVQIVTLSEFPALPDSLRDAVNLGLVRTATLDEVRPLLERYENELGDLFFNGPNHSDSVFASAISKRLPDLLGSNLANWRSALQGLPRQDPFVRPFVAHYIVTHTESTDDYERVAFETTEGSIDHLLALHGILRTATSTEAIADVVDELPEYEQPTARRRMMELAVTPDDYELAFAHLPSGSLRDKAAHGFTDALPLDDLVDRYLRSDRPDVQIVIASEIFSRALGDDDFLLIMHRAPETPLALIAAQCFVDNSRFGFLN